MPDVNAALGTLTLTGYPASVTVDPTVDINVNLGTLTLTGYTATIQVDTVMTAGFHAFIDLNGDGDFSDANEDISADIQAANWSNGIKTPYQSVADEAKCTLTMDNSTGKYNPENTGSVLSPNLLPNKKMRLYLSNGATQYLMWSGFIENVDSEWKPAGAQTGKTSCKITGVGIKQRLEQATFRGQLYRNVTGDKIVDDALMQVVLPPVNATIGWLLGIAGRSELGTTTLLGSKNDYSTVDIGSTTFASFGNSADYNCYSVIKAVTEAERGRFFQDRYGRAIWWNQAHLSSNVTVTATIADTAGSAYAPTKVDYRYGDLIANVVRVTATPRQEDTGITLWRLNSTVTIPAATTIEFEADYNSAFLSAAGAGSDVTLQNETYSSGAAVAEIYANRGIRAIIRIKNSGGSAAVLSALSIIGTAITDTNTQTVEAIDAASMLAYGKKEIQFNLKALDSFTQAQAVALFELNRRKNPRGMIRSLAWRKQTGTVHAQIAWTMGMRFTVQLANGHAADHFVIGEAHNWMLGANGGVHDTTLYLEPA